MLQLAVAEALKPVEHLEEASEFERIRQKFCMHFTRASKKMEVNLSFVQMVDAFTDHALTSLFSAFWDKDWLCEIDFVVPLTVALRDRYPRFSKLSHFDRAAAEAADKLLDVKRAEAAVWEAVQAATETKMIRGKLNEAVDTARKSAMPWAAKAVAGGMGGADGMETFMTQWIIGAVNSLKATSGGKPEKTVDPATLAALFNSLCEKGAFPKMLTDVFGQPPTDWPVIQATVEEAYSGGVGGGAGGAGASVNEAIADWEQEAPPAKRCRSREEGYGSLSPGLEEQKAWRHQVRHMQRWAGGNGWNKKKW